VAFNNHLCNRTTYLPLSVQPGLKLGFAWQYMYGSLIISHLLYMNRKCTHDLPS